jgi:hypothetical protein
MKPADADFGVTVDFAKGQSDPVAVFASLTQLLKGFGDLDDVLIEALHPELEPVMVIEDVEAASITTWVRNKLRNSDDELIKAGDWKKVVGQYAVKAKYRVLEYLDTRADKEETQRLTTLRNDLERLASESEFRAIPVRISIPLNDLVVPLDRIQEAKSLLSKSDRLVIKSDGDEHEVDLTVTKRPSDFLPLSEPQLTSGEMEMVLLIKKPDYLGESLWEFRHGTTPIYAHILDAGWLDRFHHGKEIITPGSALVCQVSYSYGYDENGALQTAKHEILKVLRVIRGREEQTSFLPT